MNNKNTLQAPYFELLRQKNKDSFFANLFKKKTNLQPLIFWKYTNNA